MIKDMEERRLNSNEIELKDDILDALGGEPTEESIRAMTAAMIELICLTAPSLASAIQAVSVICISMADVIIKADEIGMCRWSKDVSVQ